MIRRTLQKMLWEYDCLSERKINNSTVYMVKKAAAMASLTGLNEKTAITGLKQKNNSEKKIILLSNFLFAKK